HHELGFGFFKLQPIDNDNLAVTVLQAERGKQSLSACFARHTKPIVFRLGAKNRAPSNPERRSYTAGARPSRTFLPPRFLSTSGDKSLGLGGCSARTPVIELHDHSLMQQVRPGLYAKYFFFKFRMDDVNFHGFTLSPPAAQRQFHAWPRERPL